MAIEKSKSEVVPKTSEFVRHGNRRILSGLDNQEDGFSMATAKSKVVSTWRMKRSEVVSNAEMGARNLSSSEKRQISKLVPAWPRTKSKVNRNGPCQHRRCPALPKAKNGNHLPM